MTYENNVLLHPIRAVKIALRRWLIRKDATEAALEREQLPPVLEQFQRGETFPLKGVSFRVARLVGGDFPAMIVIPVGVTRGAKLKALRTFRDMGRERLAEQKHTAKQLRKAAR